MDPQAFLKNYPFNDRDVELAEGFEAYDGILGDAVGAPHRGIDYVKREHDALVPFGVYAMHDGEAYAGVSETWGNFVGIDRPASGGIRFLTIYAHLDESPPHVPVLERREGERPIRRTRRLKAGELFGRAGTSGAANGIPHLHIELHRINDETDESAKIDPYGVAARASSGLYPATGASLAGLPHYWVSDDPPLA